VKAHRLAILFGALGCAALGALAPATGCNGTGVTPMCDFPDGTNNPEAGCGELVEAAAEDAQQTADTEQPPVVDSSIGAMDASDAKTTPVMDSAVGEDAHDASDAHDAHIEDAPHDAPHDTGHDAKG
jgi:hypothetical protein